ncbi:uncharacterized protein TNCV_870801 [Trichonephila clavipes]|nr:uncharacterized protein TNCV_870801 [Trichonephila clavipes]
MYSSWLLEPSARGLHVLSLSIVALKTCHIEEWMHVKSVQTQSLPLGATTDRHETNSLRTPPPASRTSREIRVVRKGPPHPKIVERGDGLEHSKRDVLFYPPPTPWLPTLTAVPLGLCLNPREDIDVWQCIVHSEHEGTLNSHRAASPLVQLMEEEENWEAPDHPQGFHPQNWDETERNRSVWCSKLRRQLAFCRDEFPGT